MDIDKNINWNMLKSNMASGSCDSTAVIEPFDPGRRRTCNRLFECSSLTDESKGIIYRCLLAEQINADDLTALSSANVIGKNAPDLPTELNGKYQAIFDQVCLEHKDRGNPLNDAAMKTLRLGLLHNQNGD